MSNRLKEFVNNKPVWDSFLEELDGMIELERRSLEQTTEYGDMRSHQGGIRVLRKLKLLRDKVNGQQ